MQCVNVRARWQAWRFARRLHQRVLAFAMQLALEDMPPQQPHNREFIVLHM